MHKTAFDIFHPAIPITLFACIIINVMCAFHPFYLLISLIVGVAYSSYLFGLKSTCKSLVWQLPFALIICAINPFFSASGSTLLFNVGLRAIYLESLIYGLCMGIMLVSALVWFKCTFAIVDIDKVTTLFAKLLPSVTLMTSMAMRLVPEFLRRGKTISNVQAACTSANVSKTGKKKTAGTFRNITVLMAWSMEDSLLAADSMKVSGWGSASKRTTYQLTRFRARDAFFLILIVATFSLSMFFVLNNLNEFSFYPKITSISVGLTSAPFVVLLFLPYVLEVFDVVYLGD